MRGWRAAEFREALTGRIDAERLELCLRLHDLVPDWISSYAKEIADTAGGLIGFTTTFQQNTASLALARELKQLDPALRGCVFSCAARTCARSSASSARPRCSPAASTRWRSSS
ncbi:hypothetical protein AB0I53_48515 [Saccharopolyspora sp. NPDC050389]|uniref:hypothetical protein n=1 Tax=Saccharopolyspora sp. NPDC050389 TaxID=3155516 RepID=UPI0033CEB737